MTSPVQPTTYTADGVLTTFALGFPVISEDHIRVIKNGVLQTKGTHYAVVEPTSRTPSIRFLTAPTSTHVIKFYRNTPLALVALNPQISHVEARQALYRQQELGEARRLLAFNVNATDTAAGTAQSIIAPCDGYIEAIQTEITETITTGGAVTVEVDAVAVTGLSITIANSAAVGLVQRDTPTTAQSSTTQVKRGQTITVTPAAAFATAGAFKGFLEFQPADL